MKAENFCYWLNGLFELGAPKALRKEQVVTIKRHLAMVFAHDIDPSQGSPEHQAELQEIHGGVTAPVIPEGLEKEGPNMQASPGGRPTVYRC